MRRAEDVQVTDVSPNYGVRPTGLRSDHYTAPAQNPNDTNPAEGILGVAGRFRHRWRGQGDSLFMAGGAV